MTASASPLDILRARFADPLNQRVVDLGDIFVVKAHNADGFDVRFEIDEDGCNVSFDHWIELFGMQDQEQAIACFDDGLSGRIRVVVHARGGVDYRWVAERFEEGEWQPVSTTFRPLFPFWRRKTSRTLRNMPIG